MARKTKAGEHYMEDTSAEGNGQKAARDRSHDARYAVQAKKMIDSPWSTIRDGLTIGGAARYMTEQKDMLGMAFAESRVIRYKVVGPDRLVYVKRTRPTRKSSESRESGAS